MLSILTKCRYPVNYRPPAWAPPGRASRCRPLWCRIAGRRAGSARSGGDGAGESRSEQAGGTARRDPRHDAPLDHLVGVSRRSPAPLAARAPRRAGCFAGQCHDPASPLGGELWRPHRGGEEGANAGERTQAITPAPFRERPREGQRAPPRNPADRLLRDTVPHRQRTQARVLGALGDLGPQCARQAGAFLTRGGVAVSHRQARPP